MRSQWEMASHEVVGAHGAHLRLLVRALLLSAGVIPGAQVGARLAQRFQGPAIVRFLAVALLALGARLVYAGLRG